MKGTSFKRTDKTIDLKAAENFVNDSTEEQLRVVPAKIESSNKKKIEKANTIDKDEIKEFLLRMPISTHRKLKIKAAEEDDNMNKLILDAIEKQYFSN